MSGLQSQCDATLSKFSPGGTAERMSQDAILGYFYQNRASPGPCPGTFSAVPAGLVSVECVPRTDVLGYSQPSLRD